MGVILLFLVSSAMDEDVDPAGGAAGAAGLAGSCWDPTGGAPQQNQPNLLQPQWPEAAPEVLQGRERLNSEWK